MPQEQDTNPQPESMEEVPSGLADDAAPQGQDEYILDASESISEAVVSSGDRLSEAIVQLEETLSQTLNTPDSITTTEIGFAIFVAFIGALSAYLFNFFHWKTVTRRENQSRAGVALARIVSEVEKLAVEYWLRDYRSAYKEIDRAQEVALISKTRLVSKYVDIFIKCHEGRNDAAIQRLEGFKSAIYDVVTGDDFESRNRKASKAKALKISTLCSEATGIISSMDFHP